MKQQTIERALSEFNINKLRGTQNAQNETISWRDWAMNKIPNRILMKDEVQEQIKKFGDFRSQFNEALHKPEFSCEELILKEGQLCSLKEHLEKNIATFKLQTENCEKLEAHIENFQEMSKLKPIYK